MEGAGRHQAWGWPRLASLPLARTWGTLRGTGQEERDPSPGMPGQERTRQEGTPGREPRAILEERSQMIRLTGQWGVDVAWPLSRDSGVEGLCVERGRGEESGERGRPRRGAREAWHEGLPRPGTSGPLRGTEEVPAHARPAPPRLQAGASPRGVSPTEAPTLPPSPPRKGRPAGRSAERRGQERGEGALGPPQPGSWPLQPRPLRGKKNNKKKEV